MRHPRCPDGNMKLACLRHGSSGDRPERGNRANGELLHDARKNLPPLSRVLGWQRVLLPRAKRTRAGFRHALILTGLYAGIQQNHGRA